MFDLTITKDVFSHRPCLTRWTAWWSRMVILPSTGHSLKQKRTMGLQNVPPITDTWSHNSHPDTKESLVAECHSGHSLYQNEGLQWRRSKPCLRIIFNHFSGTLTPPSLPPNRPTTAMRYFSGQHGWICYCIFLHATTRIIILATLTVVVASCLAPYLARPMHWHAIAVVPPYWLSYPTIIQFFHLAFCDVRLTLFLGCNICVISLVYDGLCYCHRFWWMNRFAEIFLSLASTADE